MRTNKSSTTSTNTRFCLRTILPDLLLIVLLVSILPLSYLLNNHHDKVILVDHFLLSLLADIINSDAALTVFFTVDVNALPTSDAIFPS